MKMKNGKGPWLILLILLTAGCKSPLQFENIATQDVQTAQETSSQDRAVVTTELEAALKALDLHIKGTPALTSAQVAAHKAKIDAGISTIGANSSVISAAFTMVNSYERIIGPLFINPYTQNFTRSSLPADIHTAALSVMQGIMDYVFTKQNLAAYETLLSGFSFKSSEYFPGKVTSTADPTVTHTAKIDGSYPKTFGHPVMQETNPAVKPTGTYLVPGSIAAVTVPSSLVGTGYRIRVGAHTWDFSNKPTIKRLDRSTVVYDITSAVTKIASPLGGGIYIEVPYQASAGVVDVSIKNAVRSPYYSMKSFHQTSLSQWQNVERKFGAPWADFQTDKYMIQVPTSWIYNFSDPSAGLKEWDKATDIVSDLMGFPRKRGRETLYLQVDVSIRGSAYHPGYPSVNAAYDPRAVYNGNLNHYFLTGVQYSPYYELHEMGHGQLFQKFPGETEAAVNLLYVAVMNRGYGMSLEEAFRKSSPVTLPNITLANTALEWMTSENFKLEKPMVPLEMQYQAKGYAKYVEIVNLFGWTALDNYWKSFNQDYESGVTIDTSNNGLIFRMSKAAGADLSPLIHFWGAQPEDVPALQASLAAAGIPRSQKILDMLKRNQSSLPKNNLDFRNFAAAWYGKQPSPDGYMTEAYHAVLWDSYNEYYAAGLRNVLDKIIQMYYSSSLQVAGGTGSGSYTPGTVVAIKANAPASGVIFDKWNVTSGNTAAANPVASATTLTMPAGAVSVAAVYKTVNTSGTNVALGKSASQSSTAYADATAARGVDGNTDGNWSGGSLNHTNYEIQPWWMVNLGADFNVRRVNVWNRTDAVSERLSSFRVEYLDSAGNILQTAPFPGTAGTLVEFNNAVSGVRSVRVVLNGTNYLHLAEVQVYGEPSAVAPAGYTLCADEGQAVNFGYRVDVAYGAGGKFAYKTGLQGSVAFSNATFGDPAPGVRKYGFYRIEDKLTTGQTLTQGQTIVSADGRYKLKLQTDGNLVIYNPSNRAVWATNTTGSVAYMRGSRLTLLSNGNLVLYNSSNVALWKSGTASSGAVRLHMLSDGNLCLYTTASGYSGWVWGTNTNGK